MVHTYFYEWFWLVYFLSVLISCLIFQIFFIVLLLKKSHWITWFIWLRQFQSEGDNLVRCIFWNILNAFYKTAFICTLKFIPKKTSRSSVTSMVRTVYAKIEKKLLIGPKQGFYLCHSDLECPMTFVNSKMTKFQIFNFFLL